MVPSRLREMTNKVTWPNLAKEGSSTMHQLMKMKRGKAAYASTRHQAES